MTDIEDTMRFSQIRRLDISNGEAIGITLFTSGCPIHCKNCFNSELWDMTSGSKWTKKEQEIILDLLKPDHIRRFSVLGGEPLIERNIKPLTELITKIRELYGDKKKIWIWTGNLYENVSKLYPDLLKLIDILVDGPFVDELKDANLKWRGSSNQRVIDIQKTLKSGKIELFVSKWDDMTSLKDLRVSV